MNKIKKIFALIMAISVFAVMIPTAMALENEINIFVSQNGNDSNEGSMSAPLKTLEGAKNKIRSLKKSSNLSQTKINVNIREGSYTVESFSLTKEDSGSKDFPVTYRAWKDEEVSVSGGYTIESKFWSLVEDEAILKRLPEEARGNVYQADFNKMGLTKEEVGIMGYFGGYSGSELYQSNTPVVPMGVELFLDGIPQTIARYPNEGYIYIKNVVKPCVEWSWEGKTEPRPVDMDPSGFIINYEDKRTERWLEAEDARMYGFWKSEWADSTVDIIDIDLRKRTIESGQAVAHGIKAYDGTGGRYYVFNLLEEIDMPGEYFLNPETLIMYYYPKGDISKSNIVASVSTKNIISIKNAEHITFEGLTIEATREQAISVSDSDDICFNFCTIRNTGNIAAEISMSKNSGFSNCHIYNTNGGIKIYNDDESRKALVPTNNYVKNCEIHDYSRYKKMYNPAVMFYGVGNYIGHNKIYNGSHMAIWMLDSNDSIVEYNDIYNVLCDSTATGAFYSGMNVSQAGNVYRYNYVHDSGKDYSGLNAFFVAEGDSNLKIYGNIVKNIGSTGTMAFITGSNLDIENNISINLTDSSVKGSLLGKKLSDSIYQKLKYFIEDTKYGSLWLEKWPFLKDYLNDISSEFMPKNNVIKNNVTIDGKSHSLPDAFIGSGEIKDDYSAGSKEVTYKISTDGKITIDQEKIKKQIPEWEIIDTSKIGIIDELKYRSDFTAAENSGNSNADDKLSNAVILAIGKNKALAKNTLKQIDPDNVSVFPQIVNSRTLVPVRFISENFGAEVGWDEATKTVTLKLNGKKVTMQIGSDILTVDGIDTKMDVTPLIIENRTMIPLRALCETALGKTVFWDNKGLIVISDDNIADSISNSDYVDSLLKKLEQ